MLAAENPAAARYFPTPSWFWLDKDYVAEKYLNS
jgi:hypothetical protein